MAMASESKFNVYCSLKNELTKEVFVERTEVIAVNEGIEGSYDEIKFVEEFDLEAAGKANLDVTVDLMVMERRDITTIGSAKVSLNLLDRDDQINYHEVEFNAHEKNGTIIHAGGLNKFAGNYYRLFCRLIRQ